MAPETDDPDPYEALRARIKSTQEAVDRLARETGWAQGEPSRAGDPPRTGPAPAGSEAAEEVRALVALVELLRDVLPPELRAQLSELVRQLLILLRTILDWWIERIGAGPGAERAEPVVVEDIEIT